MKRALMILSTLSVFLFVSALSGSAQQNRQTVVDPYYDYGLNLTSEQLTRIQELRLEFQKDILSSRMQLQTHYVELRTMYMNETDQAKIEAKIDQIDKSELELEKKWMDHQAQIRNLLTDEQKVIFDRWGGLGLGWGMMGGRGLGRGLGMGPGMGWGRGWGRGFGPGWSRGWGRSWARGWNQGWGRGMGRGFFSGWGRGWSRGPGMGRGFWCPWFRNRW
jgi:Spy/CpxP family protein refolding chaperone